jgi:hypothetical protein
VPRATSTSMLATPLRSAFHAPRWKRHPIQNCSTAHTHREAHLNTHNHLVCATHHSLHVSHCLQGSALGGCLCVQARGGVSGMCVLSVDEQ